MYNVEYKMYNFGKNLQSKFLIKQQKAGRFSLPAL